MTFLSFKQYKTPHMEKYFHLDHTAYPNLVTKSQRCAKSLDFYEKEITFFIENEVMSCY